MHIFDSLKSRSDICFLSFNDLENKADLIPGYNFYLIKFNGVVDLYWIKQQSKKVNGKIAVISSAEEFDNTDNVKFFKHLNWNLSNTFESVNPIKTHKFSVNANVLTQANTWVLSKLLEYKDDCIVNFDNSIINNADFDEWGFTSNAYLDNLIDNFTNNHNGVFQQNNFENSALSFVFTNYHYSFMMDDFVPYIHPGPYISENILNCLASGQAFIPCGQYNIYNTLTKYGFKFDYDFDISWDNDQGNLSRFEKICKLIDILSECSITDIINATKELTAHNLEYFYSEEFKNFCNKSNNDTLIELHKYVN